MRNRDLVDSVVSRLPDRLAARIDSLRPGLADGFSGPLNGQARRIAAVSAILATVPHDLIVETGTHRGTSTLWFREHSSVRIVTIEASRRFAGYAHRRLRSSPDVRVIHGDSPAWLRRLAKGRKPVAATQPFFYLDAHGGGPLPLRFEILEVTSCWASFCAVVDDFQVPDDPGYGYDSYGPGFALTTDLLVGLDLTGVHVFWPSASAADETGHRRGTLVLARGDDIVAALRRVTELREDGGLVERLRAQAAFRP